MTKLLFTVAFLFAVCTVYAQDKLPGFGKADIKELMLQEYAEDRSATAIKLLDYRESEFFIDLDFIKLTTERRVRIKILKKEGYKYATVSLPYTRHNRAKIGDITAYIYYLNEKGEAVTEKLDSDEIYRNQSKEGLRKVAFTFPNVKPGCVIEYKYTKKEKSTLHLDPWFFQDEIPTLLSVCKIISPSKIEIEKRLITSRQVNEKTSSQKHLYSTDNITTLEMKNIAAFKMEPLMSSFRDNIQRAEFTIVRRYGIYPLLFMGNKKWQTYTGWLYAAPFFGKHFTAEIIGTKSLLDSAALLKTTQQKINFIYTEVKKKIKWDDHQTFYAGDIDECWQTGFGNSAEMNLTLFNLLKKSGVDCFPILISTRQNGKTDEHFPSLSQFNGVDVLVSDSSDIFILDATQKFLSYKVPPQNVMNRSAFLVDSAAGGWINIADERLLQKSRVFINAILKNDFQIRGSATIEFYDHARSQQLLEEKENKEKMRDKPLKTENETITIDSVVQENETEDLKPYKKRFTFDYEMSQTGDFYFLNPFVLSSFSENPFRDSVRNSSIEFGSNQQFDLFFSLSLPDNAFIEELPTNQRVIMADSSLSFTVLYQKSEGLLMCRSNFLMHRSIYEKEEYDPLKKIFEKMYAIINQRVILKKLR